MNRLIEIGKVKPKNSSQVNFSKLGVGFEKLDRDAFDPEKAYDKVADLGVKWVRIQSGWAKTEQEKGVYNFAWLDSVVDNLLDRGLKPWLCLCYGNGLYDEKAAEVFGCVGCPPIHTEEAKSAWSNYVESTVKHFEGRIEYYEIWNEPDGIWCWKHGPSGSEYGQFAIDTAKAIKSASKNAKIIGGAICFRDLHFLSDAFKVGLGDYIDAISFHEYTAKEDMVFDRVSSLKGLCNLYNPKIEIIQGESGSQSKMGGAGALKEGSWTPRKQAKQLARHTIADLLCDVKFSSYFSTLDMVECLNGTVGNKESYLDYAYFGVLGADFDENGKATGDYSPKPSYYSLQTISSLFSEEFEKTDLPIIFHSTNSPFNFGFDCNDATIIKGGFKRDNNSYAFVYWNSLDLMTTEFESTVTIEVAALPFKQLKIVDLLDGSIYKIPDEMIEKVGNNSYILKNIPIKDYPLALTFGEF